MEKSPEPTESFYDGLAPVYKYIYVDWEKSVAEHGKLLDGIIRQNFSNNIRDILDASCGIGTQLIGLSEMGYRLTGADISQNELEIAGEELRKRNLSAELHRCSFKDLPACFKVKFDIVIAIDNAITHLLSATEILEAFTAMYRVSREGILISVRDYDDIDKSKMHIVPYGYRQIEGKKWFLFQRWEFEGEIISVSFFFIAEHDSGKISPVSGRVYRTKFYAIGSERLMDLLKEAGFKSTRCIRHSEMQLIIIGEK